MRGPEDRRRAATEVTPQELGLIAKVARAFRTTDRDELQAELARRLLDLKGKSISHVRNWDAYLAKFLYNKASTLSSVTASRHRHREFSPTCVTGLQRWPDWPFECSTLAADSIPMLDDGSVAE